MGGLAKRLGRVNENHLLQIWKSQALSDLASDSQARHLIRPTILGLPSAKSSLLFKESY